MIVDGKIAGALAKVDIILSITLSKSDRYMCIRVLCSLLVLLLLPCSANLKTPICLKILGTRASEKFLI
jgi:hypothetical protein